MKSRKNFRKLIIILILSIMAGWQLGQSEEPEPQATEPQILSAETQQGSEGGLFEVVRVIDGDTIELIDGSRVRYIGIDTPETGQSRESVECFARQAKAENERLVLGRSIRLEKDISHKDRYGRLLRYVYADDMFVNLALVENGFARAATFPPDVRHQADFIQAENLAREKNLGLWSECPVAK